MPQSETQTWAWTPTRLNSGLKLGRCWACWTLWY